MLSIFLLLPLHAQYTPPKKIVIEAEDGDRLGKHKWGTQKTKCGSKAVAWWAEFLDEEDDTPPALEFKIPITKAARYLFWYRGQSFDHGARGIRGISPPAISATAVFKNTKKCILLPASGDRLKWYRGGRGLVKLDAGIHTLTITFSRKRQMSFLIDTIALIELEEDVPSDEQLVPIGREKATVSLKEY
ncbi:MAG: hypothetical protein QF886_00250 [Planctomycetota bacterium]|nr:hypothetical protein [Planctomycetota bacterium]